MRHDSYSNSRALHLFRTEGRSEAADQALAEAVEWNAYVPAYLLGRKRLPSTMPDYISFGDESEAVVYAHDNRPLWQNEPGALAWLAAQAGK